MDIPTYQNILGSFISSGEFASLDADTQQARIKNFRDTYLAENPDAPQDVVDSVTEQENINYLRGTGKGRVVPKLDNIIFPNQEEGFNDLSVEDRNKKIEEFRLRIPELAKQNPHQRGDTEYFLQQSANELERRVNGEGNGRIHSMGSSLAEGFLATLADSFGATDTAESIRRTFHENPEYDDEFFTNQLSQGVGSGFASVAIMAGLALTTKGLGGTAAASEAVGTIGSLLTNGVMRYNEGYKNAIDAGLDEDKASDAGFAATPAAVIDALSDRILSSGIMPDHINKVFASGTEVEKKAMFGALIKDASYRGRLFNYAKSALGEGLSEAAGDYVAAYGPYLQNGNDKYLPTAKESINSFMLGAVIGGGMTAGFDLPNLLGNKTGVTTEVDGKKITPTYDTADQRDLAETQKSLEQIQSEGGHQEIYQMLAQGRYREAFQLSAEKIKQQDELAKKRAAVDEAVQKLKQKENPETLDENVLDLEGTDDQAPKNNINEAEQKPSGRNALIQIAKSEGVDLAKMTRQEYADYAVKHGQPLTSDEFRQRPEFRGMSKEEAKPLMDANYANTPSRKGAFTKLANFGKELRQRLNSPENASGVETEKGIKFLPSANEWLHFSINKGVKLNPKKETPKSYVGFKDIYKSITPQKIQGFTAALKEAGYNGQVKFASDIEVASNITDQLVMHAATREMADLGLETAKTYFGDQIDFTDTGSDNDGKSYSELLAERTQKASTARKSTEPLTPIQSASAAAKAERREEVRRMMSGLPPDVQQQLESIQEAEDAVDMEPGVVVGQEAFFNAQRDRFKGRLRRGFERMVSDIQARNPGLKFEVDETLDAAALYNQGENKIIFSSRAPSLRVMAHETAHAFTAQEINKHITSREGTYKEKLEVALKDKEVPQHIKDLIRVYKNAVKLAKMQHVSGQVITSDNLEMAKNMSDLEYGFTSLEEFIAEAFGSSKFQDFISQIPFEGKTVWQHLVDIVSRLMDWMSDIANPEFLMRNDGNNTLRATLGLASQFGASENTNTKNNIIEAIEPVEEVPIQTPALELQNIVEESLEEEEKQEAAAELGFQSWSKEAAVAFSERFADWVINPAKELSAKLAELFNKISKSIKISALAIGSIVTFGTTEDITSQRVMITPQNISELVPGITTEVNEVVNQNNIAQPSDNEEDLVGNQLANNAEIKDDASISDLKISVDGVPVKMAEPSPVSGINKNGYDISQSVEALANFHMDNKSNGKSFVILDKESGKMTFFDKSGSVIDSVPWLWGRNDSDFYPTGKADNWFVTPAGEFTGKLFNSQNYGLTIWFDTIDNGDGSINRMLIHRRPSNANGANPTAQRDAALASKTSKDNAATGGCANLGVKDAKRLIPQWDKGGKVYILPTTQKGWDMFTQATGFSNPDRRVAKNNINFLPNDVSDSEILRFVKVGIATQNGNVTHIGKIAIGKDGLINENRLLSVSQIPQQVFDLLKQVYPEAWDGENVNINKLIALEKERPLFETHVYGQEGSDVVKAERDQMMHEWYDNHTSSARRMIDDYVYEHNEEEALNLPGPSEAELKEVGIDLEKLKRWTELNAKLKGRPDARGPRATSYYDSISPFDTNKYPVTRIDVTVPFKQEAQTLTPTEEAWLNNYRDRKGSPSDEDRQKAYELSNRVYKHISWSEDNLHENLPNTLGWAMVQFVPDPKTGETVMFVAEQQSRWGQEANKKKARAREELKNEPNNQRLQDDLKSPHPLLDVQHKLVLKAAMEEARKRGVTKMVISDGDTAMMTEGHDKAEKQIEAKLYDDPKTKGYLVFDTVAQKKLSTTGRYEFLPKRDFYAQQIKIELSDGTWKTYDYGNTTVLRKEGDTDYLPLDQIYIANKVIIISQAKGMRQHYDRLLQSSAEKMTKSKGVPVDMGMHKNAVDDSPTNQELYRESLGDRYDDASRRIQELEREYPPIEGYLVRAAGNDIVVKRVREITIKGSPVFRNPDGTPKATATGMMYDINPTVVNNINYLPREDDQVLYHGGAYNGKGNIKTNGRGALGSGAYFTPSIETATKYSKRNGWDEAIPNGQVSKFSLQLNNPLKLYANPDKVTDPAVDALVALGVSEEKAQAKIEKAYEDQGYPGKQISSLATRMGYDGIEYYNREGKLSEVVAWNQQSIRYEGPVEKNNINYLPSEKSSDEKTWDLYQKDQKTSEFKSKADRAIHLLKNALSARDKARDPKPIIEERIMDVESLTGLSLDKNDLEKSIQQVELWRDEGVQKNNINYLPEQRRNQLAKNMFKQLAQITSGNITDTADAGTQRIIEILSKMRVADISRLDPEMKDFLSMLIQNVYNARKSGVKSPEMRLASPLMAEHLQTMLNYMEQDAIDNILNDYDGIVPMNDSVLQMGRDELESYINDYVEKNGLQEAVFEQIGKGNPEAKRKANERLQKIYAKWRERYQEIKKVAKDRFADSENYINETEAAHGAKYEDAYLRDFVKVHYDYLMGVDVSQLSGRELYEHFFAINNLIDGSSRFAPTVAFIAKQRNNEEQIQELANTFRDAVSSRNKALQWVDDTNRYAELHQVQLQRMSSFDNTRDFLQNKLLGKLHNAIVTESYNRKLAYSQEFIDFRIELEKNEFGREVNTEDRVITSIAARLMQYALGENPDKALMRNIKKERASIKNIIHNSVNTDNVKLHKARVQFIFEEMVKDLEAYGPGVMQHFMDTLPARMSGTESAAIGEVRMKWLGKAQEIFSRFNLESKTISEGFHKKPFKQYVHYMSNEVFSTDSTPRDEPKITDPISAFDQADHKIGIRSEAAHLKERQAALGDTDHYSYNLEGTFYRNVEKISVDNSTIAERFIIAKRLAPGSELNNIISQNSDEDVPHHGRVSAINTMVVNMLRNATSKGYPLDYGTKLLRSATGMYARVVLSSPHHIISQPITAFADYAMRTGNITGWLKAALYVATNHDKVHNWFMKNQRWTADRAIVEAMALDQRRSPEDDSQEYLKNHPAVKFLSKYYEGASNLLGFFIHNGDNFAVKATVLAEYERLMTQKYGRKFKSLDDLDMDIEEREILTEATMNSEKNINTSNKIFRGELFTDRRVSTTLIRNLLLPFAAHQSSLATQMNQAIRDLVELKSLGAPQSEKASKMRTIAAILMQQMTFTSMRFFLGSLSAKLIIGAIQDLFDDEEGKIAELEQNLLIAQRKGDPVKVAAAQHELENAKHVRKAVAQMQQTSQTPDSLFKQMIRDSIGSFHISFNNGSMQQVLTFIPDAWAEKSYRMGQEAVVKDLEAQIRKAKEREQNRLVGKLTEQKAMIESTQYIPLAYESVGGFGLGGLYGATLDNWKRVMVEGNQAVMGVNEWNWTDFMMDVAALGIGQAEFSKTMNAIDKIEDAQWKENAQYQNSKLPDAQRRKLKKSQGNLQPPSARLSELPQI